MFGLNSLWLPFTCLCCLFWLIIFFFVLGPVIVWLTGECDSDDADQESRYNQPSLTIRPVVQNKTEQRESQL